MVPSQLPTSSVFTLASVMVLTLKDLVKFKIGPNGKAVAVFEAYPWESRGKVYQGVKGRTNKDLDPSVNLIDVKLDGCVTERKCGKTIVRFVVKLYDINKHKYCIVVYLDKASRDLRVSFDEKVQVLAPNQTVEALERLKDDTSSKKCRRLSKGDREALMEMRPDFAWMRLKRNKPYSKKTDEPEPNDGAIPLRHLFLKLQHYKVLLLAEFCYTGPRCVLGDVLEGQTNDSLGHFLPRIEGVVLKGKMTYVKYSGKKILFQVREVKTHKYELIVVFD